MKDYHRKNYKNPFFKKNKSGSGCYGRGLSSGRYFFWPQTLRKKIILVLFFAAAVGWIYFIFFLPYFYIQQIKLEGLEKISRSEIEEMVNNQMAERRFLIFGQKNIFIFDEDSLCETINGKYALESIKINKKLPGFIEIKIQEKKPALIWQTGDKFYDIDGEGIAIRELLPEEIAAIKSAETKTLVVYNESNEPINIEETILAKNFVQFMLDARQLLIEKTNVKIKNFKMQNQKSDMAKVITDAGLEIYFTNSREALAQVEKLSAFLNTQKEEDKKLEYIDLRFEDRVYYK